MIGNDHAQQFFANVAPPFTLHVGGVGRGQFAGRDFKFNIASEISFALVKDFYRAGFDPAFTSTAEIDYALGIPMTHMGLVDEAVLPIYVNAYLPPQPTMERCYAFGQALARGLASLGVRAVIVASGGMSHFPGTDNYSNPALEFDKSVLEPLKEGPPQDAAWLQRAAARRKRQHRAALLGRRGRRAGRKEARHRPAQPELASQLRVARVVHAGGERSGRCRTIRRSRPNCRR